MCLFSCTKPNLSLRYKPGCLGHKLTKNSLERVEQRTVKLFFGLKQVNYNERLEELDMLTLEERRHQAGMIMTYKILTGKEDVDPSEWFVMAAEAVRSDPLQCESEIWATEYQEAFLLCKSDRGLECSPKSDKWIENGERIKRCICKILQKHCPIRLRLVIQLQEDKRTTDLMIARMIKFGCHLRGPGGSIDDEDSSNK